MASPRNKRKRKRGKGRLGPLFKLLCAGAVAVALTMGATVFFQVETVAVTATAAIPRRRSSRPPASRRGITCSA